MKTQVYIAAIQEEKVVITLLSEKEMRAKGV